MSRAKFDFSGYDANAMRKKKAPSPERKVIKKEDDDMEVFMSENVQDPASVNLDQKNDNSAQIQREKVRSETYDMRSNT